ncbi:N-acetylglucosamine-6-phosphate deacetylase [Ruegeria sp. HKCCD4332]|uniref:N-acetylglucosamine-6-phosphate deacetylase n=1 Tax=Ruegeria sp. HKCCD4332 TaxID=2683021 RepID=UPI001491BFEF|nr:N-acetylglucosamine-6-phosphate deacetylase [Ruegeria sp. HKCCD4332]NOD77706.1 N-acetylglucosamine-6-phosphate deacetylase [Ruegeria sp. HKCCD4332]
MNGSIITFAGGPIFDGETLFQDHAIRFVDGTVDAIIPTNELPTYTRIEDLSGDILSPGYVDLQVNGGGGVMFNDAPSVETLQRIAQAHRGLGAIAILPTLITDTPAKTTAAIQAAIQAVRQRVPGIAGLHLEGPHLSVRRKGAHDGALIRPMEEADLDQLLAAARELPALMVTLAPENVSVDQVKALTQAGIIVSLGHTDASFDTCITYAKAGARCATHLFNAMSQLGSREPGLVGAVLASGNLFAGLIADTVHVHSETMRAAFVAKRGPGKIFLVSDAMAVAGTDQTAFHLEGRLIRREEGRLTLQDGILAGADLDLTTAIRNLVTKVGMPLSQALAAATSVPAELILKGASKPVPQLPDMVRISPDLSEVAPVQRLTDAA